MRRLLQGIALGFALATLVYFGPLGALLGSQVQLAGARLINAAEPVYAEADYTAPVKLAPVARKEHRR